MRALGQVQEAKAASPSESAQTFTPVTLWMDWQRGNAHYGPNFIQLRQPCQNSDEVGCACRVRFATRSPEFADYIASFGDGKVPVVYQVIYSSKGEAVGARFLSVGTWSRDKFPSPNDGLVGIEFRNEVPRKGQQTQHRVSLPAACFPTVAGAKPSQDSNTVRTPNAKPKLEEEVQSTRRVRIPQREAEGLLVTKVRPEYPQDARDKRIQGMVILDAQISEKGNVTAVTVVSGHPLLAPTAIEAVKQWIYRPYSVKGEPVAVETKVTVNFRLPQDSN
jgi:TonB family protein